MTTDPQDQPFLLGWALLAVGLLGATVYDTISGIEPVKAIVVTLGGLAAVMFGRGLGLSRGYFIGLREAHDEARKEPKKPDA